MGRDQQYDLASEEVAAKLIDGEAVIINLETGVYYSLGGAGATVWAMLAAGHTPNETIDQVAVSYDEDRARVADDVDALVADLASEGLIAPTPCREAQPPDFDIAAERTYWPPVVERYSDLSDLLALDPPLPRIEDLPSQ